MEVSLAIGEATKLADVDVVAAYPITPQTHIVEHIAELVANGELRYVYLEGGGQQSGIAAWVRAHGKVVQGYDAQTQNAGAPDGIGPGTTTAGGGFGRGFGGTQVTLYDLGRGN